MSNRDVIFVGTEDELKSLLTEISSLPKADERISLLSDFFIKLSNDNTDSNSSLTSSEKNDYDDLEESPDYPCKLYFRDSKHHIRMKEIILEFMVAATISFVSTGTVELSAILSSIWTVRSSIIKIPDNCHCAYLKILYFDLSRCFTAEVLYNKYIKNECNCRTSLFTCPYRSENDVCKLTLKDLNEVLDSMEKVGIIEPIEGDVSNGFKLRQ